MRYGLSVPTEWFAAAPKVATKLVLVSLDLARWVAAFSSLHDFTSRRRIDTRGFSFDLLSIECVEGKTNCYTEATVTFQKLGWSGPSNFIAL